MVGVLRFYQVFLRHNNVFIKHKEKPPIFLCHCVSVFCARDDWCLNTIHPGFLLQGPPHKCALFFVDNSGVDIILGVIPFVRELLSRGTEVRNRNNIFTKNKYI